MPYYKAKEEAIWKRNKRKEEEILRRYNFPEEKISLLYQYDWKLFKKERNYRLHEIVSEKSFLLMHPVKQNHSQFKNINEMLDNIQDELLLEKLRKEDTCLLTILFLRTHDYSVKEIAALLNISSNSIYKKIEKFRKSFKL